MSISVFTKTQSSAISMIEIEGNLVDIAFQSAPGKVYTFASTPEFTEALQLIINGNVEDVSLGSLIATARKNNQLTYSTQRG